MDLDSPAEFFRRLIGRGATPAREDPADMGTAFGLEASLGPVSAYFTAEGAAADDDNVEAPMTWLARRLRRPR